MFYGTLKFKGGVIDSDYTGEIMVILHNLGTYPYNVRKGQRVAQLILEKNLTPECEILDEFPQELLTTRNDSGFGSTGAF